MAIDRTAEFLAIADQASQKSPTEKRFSVQEKQVLSKSEFSVLSNQIGRGIKETTEKLANLTKLARNRDLFMDKTSEIQDLTFVIKKDIHTIKQQIAVLQNSIHNSRNEQAKTHSETVVKTLNAKLRSTVSDFKEALELRNENLKALQETKKLFTGNPRRSLETQPFRSPLLEGDHGDVIINMMQQQSSALMQMERVPTNVAMERLNAVETIERTIVELGEIFQQMGQIVAEHEFLVQRIDQNVGEIVHNTGEAEKQLAKYWAKISNNRNFIIKVFFILIFFIFVFVVFVA
jgi:syntaxin 5